jgi:peptide-methionine (S)-S-oxide reductase
VRWLGARGHAQVPTTSPDGDHAIATVAGGCFWGTELHFQRVNGVVATAVGYTQGRVDRPTYGQVSSGLTGHAEALMMMYDPKVISYGELCDILISTVDSTRLNCVGNDFGTQVRPCLLVSPAVRSPCTAGA